MHIYVNAIMYPFGFKHFSFDGNIINANNGMINMLTLIELIGGSELVKL